LDALNTAIVGLLQTIEGESENVEQHKHPIHKLENQVSSLVAKQSQSAARVAQLKLDLDLKSEQHSSELKSAEAMADKNKKEAAEYAAFLESEIESSKVFLLFRFFSLFFLSFTQRHLSQLSILWC
jgi:predicted S18 family serine protease